METRIVPLPTRVRQELTFRKDELESILPDWMTYKRFVNMSLMAIARTPKLVNCDFSSIYLSLMECARLGLYPDGRQAAIVPYKGKATLLPMVQGIIELMLRAPKVAKVEARVVYEGDYFDYAYGLESRLKHIPASEGTDEREIIASYAIVFWEHTEPTFDVVSRDELDKARQSSAAPNSPAWIIWEGEQSRKVAVKRLSKYVDLTPEAQVLIEWDHAIYGDPSMEGSVEGPSEEYKNQHVKAETEAKLESLKDRMEGNGKEEEPDPEPEIIDEKPKTTKKPMTPTKLKAWLKKQVAEIAKQDFEALQQTQIGATVGNLELCFAGDEASEQKRHSVTAYIFGIESFKELSDPQIIALMRWLNATEDSGGAWSPDPMAAKEAQAVVKAHMKKQGQQELKIPPDPADG